MVKGDITRTRIGVLPQSHEITDFATAALVHYVMPLHSRIGDPTFPVWFGRLS